PASSREPCRTTRLVTRRSERRSPHGDHRTQGRAAALRIPRGPRQGEEPQADREGTGASPRGTGLVALARRVGLGLASRGKVSDVVSWADRARAAGLESVWFHDSYFERDAVTYASAVASQV